MLRQIERAVAGTRKTGIVAMSVLNGLARKMASYPTAVVIESCRTYLDRDYAAEGKDERYLLGILRSETKRAGETGVGRTSANRNGSSGQMDGEVLIERATQELRTERGWS